MKIYYQIIYITKSFYDSWNVNDYLLANRIYHKVILWLAGIGMTIYCQIIYTPVVILWLEECEWLFISKSFISQSFYDSRNVNDYQNGVIWNLLSKVPKLFYKNAKVNANRNGIWKQLVRIGKLWNCQHISFFKT